MGIRVVHLCPLRKYSMSRKLLICNIIEGFQEPFYLKSILGVFYFIIYLKIMSATILLLIRFTLLIFMMRKRSSRDFWVGGSASRKDAIVKLFIFQIKKEDEKYVHHSVFSSIITNFFSLRLKKT